MIKNEFLVIAIILSFILPINAVAEIPEGYYDAAVGKKGAALQTTLSDIISHRDPGYDALWSIYRTTDVRDDGRVWDMYSATTDFVFGDDQCGSYGGEGDCYNREHTIPKSWRGGTVYSDAHIVVPTDGYVNNRRSNYPFGEVGISNYVSAQNFSKLGTCQAAGYSGTVFEPNDEYKGDFARIYFYAATRYCNECGNWSGEGFSGTFPHLDEWVRVMMLRWHRSDPVSEKEIKRNDAVYATTQNNRNPFVDYPELAELIFGDMTDTPFTMGLKLPSLDMPMDGTTVDMGVVALSSSQSSITKQITVSGQNLTSDLKIALSGSDFFTLSQSTISAEAAQQGATITITYTPVVAGSHVATMTISGGGIGEPVEVLLQGMAIEDFAAIDAIDISHDAFTARWISHSQADNYELDVRQITTSDNEEKLIFDETFATIPAGWTHSGYTVIEKGMLRMASGSQNGSVSTVPCDLSRKSQLTITCAPYKESDASILYIEVDGVEVAQVDCAAGEVTETINLESATENSVITFKALKSHRVYLMAVRLISGSGKIQTPIEGFPLKVGNVTEYRVENLKAESDYIYTVTAYKGANKLATSNDVIVSTQKSLLPTTTRQEFYVYAYAGTIYVDNAPTNAQINCYTLEGYLQARRTVHTAREEIRMLPCGVYLVQVITSDGCYTTRLMVVR